MDLLTLLRAEFRDFKIEAEDRISRLETFIEAMEQTNAVSADEQPISKKSSVDASASK